MDTKGDDGRPRYGRARTVNNYNSNANERDAEIKEKATSKMLGIMKKMQSPKVYAAPP